MTSKDFKKIILDKIKEVLKQRHFKKSGQSFKYSNGDLTYYVDLQSSTSSTMTELKVTVNTGIASELLYRLEEKAITSHLRGHFRKRIGDYLTLPRDTWWTVNDTETAITTANEIANIIYKKVWIEFEQITSTEDLIELWLKGMCFGLSDYTRQEYLVMLNGAKEAERKSSGI